MLIDILLLGIVSTDAYRLTIGVYSRVTKCDILTYHDVLYQYIDFNNQLAF
jgi:hypothetical protein